MKQLSALDRKLSNHGIIDSDFKMWLKDKLHPLLMFMTHSKVHFKLECTNKCQPKIGLPIIFAANHSCFMDTPLSIYAAKTRCYIFSGKQNLGFEDWLFFTLNGVIWVDRKSKNDMKESKTALYAYLNKNRPILWFAEGTWNLTENQLMLPMKWGIIDVAREANAQIIPLILDYNRIEKKCIVSFGNPILPDSEENHAEAIRTLRDNMASMRWELWEKNKTTRRSELDIEKERAQLHLAVEEYPPINWEYESSCIFHPYPEKDDVFSHLQKLKPCKENAFLFRHIKQRQRE